MTFPIVLVIAIACNSPDLLTPTRCRFRLASCYEKKLENKDIHTQEEALMQCYVEMGK